MPVQPCSLFGHSLRQLAAAGGLAELSDGQLVRRFVQQREEAAFAALMERHGSMVLGVCRRVLQDRHQAEDAFQASFLLLAQKAPSLRRPERVGSWLYGVAYRTALKARRTRSRRQAHEQPLPEGLDAALPADGLDREVCALLDDAVRQLPERYRRPLVLCYFEGKSNSQAAQELGHPRGTIATHLARARERLRQLLARRGVALSAGAVLTLLTQGQAQARVAVSLCQATLRLVALWPGERTTAAGATSAQVLSLVKGVSQAMFLDKLKKTSVGLVVLLGLALAGWAYHGAAAGTDRPSEPTAQPRLVRTTEPQPVVKAPLERFPNFVVTAPTPEIAAVVGTMAERYRKELAVKWLGKSLPRWERPCELKVVIAADNLGHVTTFEFQEGKVLSQRMELRGPLDRLLTTALPHEVTHTILAHALSQPVVRWADEGAALQAEDQASRQEHDRLVRVVLETPGRYIPLRALFGMRDYPNKNLMSLYAEGYAVTRFLVERKDARTFVVFLKDADHHGWDQALHKHYGYDRVEALEQAWRTAQRANAGRMLPPLLKSVQPAPPLPSVPAGPIVPPAPAQAAPPAPAVPTGAIASPAPALPLLYAERVLPQPKTTFTGAFPQATVAQAGKAGTLLIGYYQGVTSYRLQTVQVPGARQATQYYEPVTTFRLQYQEVSSAKVEAAYVSGKRINTKELRKLLRKERPVLVAWNSQHMDDFFRQFLRDDAIVLVISRDQMIGPAPPLTPAPSVAVPPPTLSMTYDPSLPAPLAAPPTAGRVLVPPTIQEVPGGPTNLPR